VCNHRLNFNKKCLRYYIVIIAICSCVYDVRAAVRYDSDVVGRRGSGHIGRNATALRSAAVINT